MTKFNKSNFIATFWSSLDELPKELLQKLPTNHDEMMLMRPKVQLALYYKGNSVLIGYHNPGHLGCEMGEDRAIVIPHKTLKEFSTHNSMFAEANLIVDRHLIQTELVKKITDELAAYAKDPTYRPTHGPAADLPPSSVVLQRIFEHMITEVSHFRTVRGKFY